jgi:hypothetical protein
MILNISAEKYISEFELVSLILQKNIVNYTNLLKICSSEYYILMGEYEKETKLCHLSNRSNQTNNDITTPKRIRPLRDNL